MNINSHNNMYDCNDCYVYVCIEKKCVYIYIYMYKMRERFLANRDRAPLDEEEVLGWIVLLHNHLARLRLS